MDRRFVQTLLASAAFLPVLLLLDGDGVARQLALGLATAAFLWLVVRHTKLEWPAVLCCIAVASAGEIVLSLGWGLYTYAHAIIPLYVPPGHGLFYALAAVTARQAFLQRRSAAITSVVLTAGGLLAILSLAFRNDVWGFLWYAGALALVRFSRNQLLLSACFVYTMLLEWAGTAIGNWRWAAEVPFLGLGCANPPAGVGILYILLDLVVVALVSASHSPLAVPAFARFPVTLRSRRPSHRETSPRASERVA